MLFFGAEKMDQAGYNKGVPNISGGLAQFGKSPKIGSFYYYFISFYKMYLWWSFCTLYLHACQVRVTVGDSGLCCCACVTYFER